jgi:hypothetical protein
MLFAGTTANEVFPPLLAVAFSVITLLVFLAAEGQKSGWSTCIPSSACATRRRATNALSILTRSHRHGGREVKMASAAPGAGAEHPDDHCTESTQAESPAPMSATELAL